MTNLLKINLSYCKEISDDGLLYLYHMTNLININLTCCKEITNGLLYLSNMKYLKTLELSHCMNITSKGLLHIPNLDYFSLFNSKGINSD